MRLFNRKFDVVIVGSLLLGFVNAVMAASRGDVGVVGRDFKMMLPVSGCSLVLLDHTRRSSVYQPLTSDLLSHMQSENVAFGDLNSSDMRVCRTEPAGSGRGLTMPG